MTQARETLGIHPVAAADVISGRQQPKVQKFEEHLFVLLWQIIVERESKGRRARSDLSLHRRRVAVDGAARRRGRTHRPHGTRERIAPELRDSPMAAAYVVMAEIVDGYAKAAADVETALEELEEQVFTESTTEDHKRIYRVRKDIGRMTAPCRASPPLSGRAPTTWTR